MLARAGTGHTGAGAIRCSGCGWATTCRGPVGLACVAAGCVAAGCVPAVELVPAACSRRRRYQLSPEDAAKVAGPSTGVALGDEALGATPGAEPPAEARRMFDGVSPGRYLTY